MKRVIGAQLAGEDLERFEKLSDRRGEDKSESQLIRELLLDGIEKREKPLVVRLGVSDYVGAQIESARGREDTERDVVRRFLERAVEARDEDALDAIGVGEDDDLRAAVEEAREDGEPLDDAVRRLVREGLSSKPSSRERENRGFFGRVLPAFAGFMIAAFVLFAALGRDTTTLVATAGVAVPAAVATLTRWDRRLDTLVDATVDAIVREGPVRQAIDAVKREVIEDHPAPYPPRTLVEKIAWGDVVGIGVAVVLCVVFGAFAAVVDAVGVSVVGSFLGPFGAFAVVVVYSLGWFAWGGALIAAVLAQLALGSEAARTAASAGPSVE